MKITKTRLKQIIKEELAFLEARTGPAGAGGHHVPGAGRTGVSGHAGMGRKYAKDRLSPEGLKNYWIRIFADAGISNDEALNKLVDNEISADMILAGISVSGPHRALRSWIYGPEMKPLLNWLNINQAKLSGYTQAGDIPGGRLPRRTVGGMTFKIRETKKANNEKE